MKDFGFLGGGSFEVVVTLCFSETFFLMQQNNAVALSATWTISAEKSETHRLMESFLLEIFSEPTFCEADNTSISNSYLKLCEISWLHNILKTQRKTLWPFLQW